MRAELLGQLVAAQFEIEAALKEAGGNVGAAKESVAQLQLLNALQRQIGSASPVALAGMRNDIIATVSAAQIVAQQTRAAADTDGKTANLSDVTKNTRQTIQNVAHELFEQKKLDPYLQFQSAEDEAEYRKREAARKAYIDAELAKGTPQGALNATNVTKEQLDDAAKHGADRSPDFASMLDEVTKAKDAQLGAIKQAGLNQEPARSAPVPLTSGNDDLEEIAAIFKTAGVLPPPAEPATNSAHGLSVTMNDKAGGALGRKG